VWAHNSHVGDARATELGQAGEFNIGQLVRERHGGETALVGFTTYAGSVTAASDWGGPAERKRVRPALRRSWEASFHQTGLPRFLLETGGLEGERLERAKGHGRGGGRTPEPGYNGPPRAVSSAGRAGDS
jgi:erythromycin esterase-like protein